jgi:hypothetical protein
MMIVAENAEKMQPLPPLALIKMRVIKAARNYTSDRALSFSHK